MTEGIIKTQDELNLMIRAAQIIDDTYSAVLETIKEGDSELDVAKFIEEFVLMQGASGLSFETIVAYGKGGAEPHHEPTDAKLEKGMLVTIDMGAVYNGYCSDFTRTFAFGEVSEKQREIYDVVYQSHKLGVQATKAGMNCEELDRVCRDYIDSHGYGQYFIHTTGHGVGKVVHEAPRVGKNSTDVLQDNMVITIEPGIYLPGEMGVRIEDMVIVGRAGALSRHATELIVINR
ncbi:MAG: aminopeptidase P family protein [Bacteroides sp.]|nr:aminopeptidase P family protein [Bacillota bacterium]MCM1394459.1 aminopeptidase P family protein [[Eubacterium] siraeum]MCM1456187.1 aminopeptidase P family protein [Bacteroides sp.]